MKIVGVSMFMADCGKHLQRRLEHLVSKRGVSAWVWIVRRTNDVTDRLLHAFVDSSPVPAMVIEESWPQPADRLMAVSMAGDVAMNAALMRGAERILFHESDLISPEDVALRLGEVLDSSPAAAVAGGWPCLASEGMDESLMLFDGAARLGREMQIAFDGQPAALPFFYDSWGYRLDGQRFASVPPYSPCYRPDEPFRLDSVGSVALIDARWLRYGARMEHDGFVRLCDQIRQMEGEVWCDPRIIINQPLELWTFQNN